MKAFTILAALFAVVAFTEAYDHKPNIILYLKTLKEAPTEDELNAKPLPELIDLVVELLNKRKAGITDPEQAKLAENHIAYFTELKSEAIDSPAADQQPAESQTSNGASSGSEVIHIESEEDFDNQVKSAGSKLVVVDFFAHWCGPCRSIAPVLDEFSKKYASQAVIMKVDVDQLNELAMGRYEVHGMPTFVFLKDGKTVERFAGADAGRVESTIKKFSA